MKKKYIIILLILGMFLTLSLALGSSYAMWMHSVSQEGENAIITDCFEITFTSGNDINLRNAFPMTDGEGANESPYEFSVKNICNHAADFQINLETLNKSTLDSSFIKVDLNGHITAYNDGESNDPTLSDASSAIKLYEDTLDTSETKNYNLRLWIKEEATQSDVEYKRYNSKITIKSIFRKKYDVAMLQSGKLFNRKIKELAGSSPNEYVSDSNITSIQRSLTSPTEEDNAANVADDSSKLPIYAWFKEGIIYIYCEADKIYMNKNSSELFIKLTKLSSIDLSYFDTSKVTNMSSMFFDCNDLDSLDVSNFDTSNVTNMTQMFRGVSKIKKLDLNNFNTSKVTNMMYMFGENGELVELNLSSFDTSNVTNMEGMFNGVKKLTSLDLSHFNTAKVTTMTSMFKNMENLTNLDISKFNTTNVLYMNEMFSSTKKLSKLNLSHFDTSNVKSMESMFYQSSVEYLDVSSFNTSNVITMERMFFGMTKIQHLDLSSFDTSNVVNMSSMFRMSSALKELNLNNFNTSKVTNMSYMFEHMDINADNLKINNFDTSNVTNMKYMFGHLKGSHFDFSFLNTSSVKNMSGMFYYCLEVTSINLSGFDTSNTEDMSYMFYANNLLDEIDLSDFDTSKVTNMEGMFNGNSVMKKIYVGNKWNTAAVTTSTDMFVNNYILVGGAGTTYDSNHIDKEYARVDGGTSSPGYFTMKG